MKLFLKKILLVFFITFTIVPSPSFSCAYDNRASYQDIPYEDIINKRLASFSPRHHSSESSPSFEDWLQTLEDQLISFTLQYESEDRHVIKNSEQATGEKLKLQLIEHALKYPLDQKSSFPALAGFFFRTITETNSSSQVFLIRGLSSLAYDLRERNAHPVRVAALLSLLLRVDVPENYEFNFIQFLNSIIKVKRFDLLTLPLKGYCTLDHQYKIIEHLSQIIRGLVGHIRLDDLLILLEAHQSYLMDPRHLNANGLEILRRAYETFFLIPDFLNYKSFTLMCECLQPHTESREESLRLQDMKAQALYKQDDPRFLLEFADLVLQDDFAEYLKTMSSSQRQGVLESIRSVMLTLVFERKLDLHSKIIEKGLILAQAYPKDVNLKWLNDFYYHKALNMMGIHAYAEAVDFIKNVYLPFIERHRKKSSELYGTKPMIGCLLSLAAIRSQNDRVALEQLPNLLGFISMAESSPYPVIQSMIPFTKIVTSNILFKTGKTADRLKGKMFLTRSYALAMSELTAKKDQPGGEGIPSADFAFFLLNALELAHMDSEADALSKLLLEVNLGELLQEAKPRKSGPSKNARRKQQRKEALLRKIKEEQERRSLESAQVLSNKERDMSPASSSQEPSSSKQASSLSMAEVIETHEYPFYFQEPKKVNFAAEYRKQKASQRVKVKTRKQPAASSSQSILKEDDLAAGELPLEATSVDLSKYRFLLKDETFLTLYLPNKERGKVTLHAFKNLLAHLGGTVTNGSRHGKATMPQEDFMGIVLTLPTDTVVKPYMLNNLRDILTHIGITPETLAEKD